MRNWKNMSDAEVVAEVSDDEIPRLLQAKRDAATRVESLRNRLEMEEENLAQADAAVKEWCENVRHDMMIGQSD
jgi:hypothetical protein